MVIDQGEEVLTLNDQDSEHNKRLLFDFLIAFSETTIDLNIIVALRKEYFGDFYDELLKRRFSPEHVRVFLLRELSTEQLVGVIRFPTSRDIPPKYLQGRPQPGDHYNFDFEASLPEKIVRDLRLANIAEGGILPALQVTCERLFRTARRPWRRQLNRERPWIITWSDLARLGELDLQIDLYVDETIQEEIQRQFPMLDEIDVAEELALWKDLLYSMVLIRPDNSVVTVIRSESELQNDPAIVDCPTDFRQMCKALTRDERRILRLDTRGSACDQLLRTIVCDSASSQIATRLRVGEAEDEKYFSLGHDAIAVALSKWGATSKNIRGNRDFIRHAIRLNIILIGCYLIVLGIIIGWRSISDFDLSKIMLSGLCIFFGILIYIFSEAVSRLFFKRLLRWRLFPRLLGSYRKRNGPPEANN